MENIGSRLGVAWDLQLADDVHVPGEVTENLLRIIREAITNPANHGARSMSASASNRAGRSGSSLRTTAAGSTRIGKSQSVGSDS